MNSLLTTKNGSGKSARRHRSDAALRALLAHELENDYRLPRKRACAVAGASYGYTATLSKATAAERDAVKRGQLSLATLHNRPSDAALDRIITRFGLDRIWAALERATRPPTNGHAR